MLIDLHIDELRVLSDVIINFKSNGLHHIMSSSDDALLNNILNKVDNILSV